MTDELLDIVDEYDQVIGQQHRTEVYSQNLKNFRVINAFLVNNQQEVWIPRRSANKKLFPLCLDTSVGGHVKAGESYEQAFERELYEELNIELNTVSAKLLAKLTPSHNEVSAFMHLYIIESNTSPTYNKTDFTSAAWYTIRDLQRIIRLSEKTKGDLPILVNFLQSMLAQPLLPHF